MKEIQGRRKGDRKGKREKETDEERSGRENQ
jgi:hypothetical protein